MSKPDLSIVEDIVAPRVVGAMRTTSRLLSELHVNHVVVGGLAVGANGYPVSYTHLTLPTNREV